MKIVTKIRTTTEKIVENGKMKVEYMVSETVQTTASCDTCKERDGVVRVLEEEYKNKEDFNVKDWKDSFEVILGNDLDNHDAMLRLIIYNFEDEF